MKQRADVLARRQQGLLVRSSELRSQFARGAQAWQQPLALADQVQAAWRWLRANPAVPLAAAAGFVLLRPRRAWRLAWRVWAAWGAWKRVRSQMTPLRGLRR